MPLSTEVGLGPGRIVLHGDPAPTFQKGHSPPPHLFGPCLRALWSRSSISATVELLLLWPNGWMDEDSTWYTEVDLGPGHIVLDGVPALRERGTASISATTAELF